MAINTTAFSSAQRLRCRDRSGRRGFSECCICLRCIGDTCGSLDDRLFQCCQIDTSSILNSSCRCKHCCTYYLSRLIFPGPRQPQASATATTPSETIGSRSSTSSSAARFVGSAAEAAASIGGYLSVFIAFVTALGAVVRREDSLQLLDRLESLENNETLICEWMFL